MLSLTQRAAAGTADVREHLEHGAHAEATQPPVDAAALSDAHSRLDAALPGVEAACAAQDLQGLLKQPLAQRQAALARRCTALLQLAAAVSALADADGQSPAAAAAACPASFWPGMAQVQHIGRQLLLHADNQKTSTPELRSSGATMGQVDAPDEVSQSSLDAGRADAGAQNLPAASMPAHDGSSASFSFGNAGGAHAAGAECTQGFKSITLYTTTINAPRNVLAAERRLEQIFDAFSVPFKRIDLAIEPQRRSTMVHGAGEAGTALPQLHVDGALLAPTEELFEMHDFGELLPALRAEAAESEEQGVDHAPASMTVGGSVAGDGLLLEPAAALARAADAAPPGAISSAASECQALHAQAIAALKEALKSSASANAVLQVAAGDKSGSSMYERVQSAALHSDRSHQTVCSLSGLPLASIDCMSSQSGAAAAAADAGSSCPRRSVLAQRLLAWSSEDAQHAAPD